MSNANTYPKYIWKIIVSRIPETERSNIKRVSKMFLNVVKELCINDTFDKLAKSLLIESITEKMNKKYSKITDRKMKKKIFFGILKSNCVTTIMKFEKIFGYQKKFFYNMFNNHNKTCIDYALSKVNLEKVNIYKLFSFLQPIHIDYVADWFFKNNIDITKKENDINILLSAGSKIMIESICRFFNIPYQYLDNEYMSHPLVGSVCMYIDKNPQKFFRVILEICDKVDVNLFIDVYKVMWEKYGYSGDIMSCCEPRNINPDMLSRVLKINPDPILNMRACIIFSIVDNNLDEIEKLFTYGNILERVKDLCRSETYFKGNKDSHTVNFLLDKKYIKHEDCSTPISCIMNLTHFKIRVERIKNFKWIKHFKEACYTDNNEVAQYCYSNMSEDDVVRTLPTILNTTTLNIIKKVINNRCFDIPGFLNDMHYRTSVRRSNTYINLEKKHLVDLMKIVGNCDKKILNAMLVKSCGWGIDIMEYLISLGADSFDKCLRIYYVNNYGRSAGIVRFLFEKKLEKNKKIVPFVFKEHMEHIDKKILDIFFEYGLKEINCKYLTKIRYGQMLEQYVKYEENDFNRRFKKFHYFISHHINNTSCDLDSSGRQFKFDADKCLEYIDGKNLIKSVIVTFKTVYLCEILLQNNLRNTDLFISKIAKHVTSADFKLMRLLVEKYKFDAHRLVLIFCK